ncbi:uncharacterized protein BDW47DRAFT_54741 [Aspergillus candidus]|uniref:Amidohydrolase-related domain-containing protein n=1 Tax=Aspergillus candidus TaxID=41067 RepID=A0A2I2F5Y7_ASPCN|nr:hypothetical protein BDW47DRAFT_54741 [Aspergillus candidus]PLB36052.1 hypothetical protein BDW47DRAFT_54741 [Aspergillus candidus]
MSIPIVDSHIHLFPKSHLPTFTWYTEDSPLASQHSVDEYRAASTHASHPQPRGFIFLETDRLSSIDDTPEGHGWTHPLDEVSFLTRIISGAPHPGEGHTATDQRLCLALIPWAPVPGGPSALEAYMAQVRARTGTNTTAWKKVRGVRYLVQDKPRGVMGQRDFIEGVQWLGRQGLTFDLGVDARSGGLWQLEEAVEMMETVYGGVALKEQTSVIINHLCKPNLRLSGSDTTEHMDFRAWKALVERMARWPKTYMKLSGAFSELPPLSAEKDPDILDLVQQLQPWVEVIFRCFRPERVMFGSDWPVCNIGGGGNAVSWGRWQAIVEGILERQGLNEGQKRRVWGGTAVEAYGIEV